jgi:hypothetical protein
MFMAFERTKKHFDTEKGNINTKFSQTITPLSSRMDAVATLKTGEKLKLYKEYETAYRSAGEAYKKLVKEVREDYLVVQKNYEAAKRTGAASDELQENAAKLYSLWKECQETAKQNDREAFEYEIKQDRIIHQERIQEEEQEALKKQQEAQKKAAAVAAPPAASAAAGAPPAPASAATGGVFGASSQPTPKASGGRTWKDMAYFVYYQHRAISSDQHSLNELKKIVDKVDEAEIESDIRDIWSKALSLELKRAPGNSAAKIQKEFINKLNKEPDRHHCVRIVGLMMQEKGAIRLAAELKKPSNYKILQLSATPAAGSASRPAPGKSPR